MRYFVRISVLTVLFTAIGMFAQKPVQQTSNGNNSPNIANVKGDVNIPASAPAPQLSTADKLALQSIQNTQADAAKTWKDAEQQKLEVLREWQAAHPGFHIHYSQQVPNDPANYTVEADVKAPAPQEKHPAPVKTEPPPVTPKK